MSLRHFIPIPVYEDSQPGSARREAARIAGLQGMSENDIGRVSVVVTEAAKNLVKHGKGGELLLHGWAENGALGVDLLALDKGKGMSNLAECMRDGFSTSGTPGTGLGAIQRMSDQFEIYSQPNAGTVLYSRIEAGRPAPKTEPGRLAIGVLVVPVIGEDRCGDSWAQRLSPSHSMLMVVDGLGHGAGAAEAADEAVAAFHRVSSENPLDVLDEAHHSLRKTRGAAMAVASIDHNTRKVRYAGVGNISATIVGPEKSQSMVSQNGIVGHSAARMQDFTYDWPAGSVLAMYSDGISSHWSLAKYPGLQTRLPLLAAGVIYRDHSRRRDDATVLIARERTAPKDS